jgi:hypothetical protein
MEKSKKIAYIIVTVGTLLAGINSVVPFYDDAYQLKFGILLWTIVPYYAYLLLTGIISGAKLILPGIFMLVLDILARVYSWRYVPAESVTTLDLYLPVVLLLIIMPAGYLVGARLWDGRQEKA